MLNKILQNKVEYMFEAILQVVAMLSYVIKLILYGIKRHNIANILSEVEKNYDIDKR